MAYRHVRLVALTAFVAGIACGVSDDPAAGGPGGNAAVDDNTTSNPGGGKADELGDPSGSGRSTTAGVNLSRYRAATAGCWMAEQGYWNPSCTVISARDAVAALESTGMSKVKLFAPGPYPVKEFEWFFPKWEEDLTALGKSAAGFELFVGIPNSALFEIVGVPFAMPCGSEVYSDIGAALGLAECGAAKQDRVDAVLAYIFKALEAKASHPPAIACKEAGTTFDSASEALASGSCTTEEISSALAQALVTSETFMADVSGPEKWLDKYVLKYVDPGSSLKVEYIGVGNEPFAPWYHDVYDALVLVAMKKTQTCLTKSSSPVLSSAKVTVPFAGTYAGEPLLIEQVLGYLDDIDSIFMQNIYPHGDAFSSSLTYVKAQQKTLQPELAPLQDDEDPEIVVISKKDLTFVKDFIAWSTGQRVSEANTNTWSTPSFYEAYLAGYEQALAKGFGRAYDLPIYAGETGWPSHNAHVYYYDDGKEVARALGFDDLVFEERDGTSVATLPYLKFKQMVSNAVFSRQSAANFVQSVVKLWNSSDGGGYLFELHDEAHKENEAEGMDFDLEAHFGLFELQSEANGSISYDSKLRLKFEVNFFASR